MLVELHVLITDGNVEVAVSTGRELVKRLITVGNVEGIATAGNVGGKATVDRELVEGTTIGKLFVDGIGGNCTCVLVCSLFTTSLENIGFMDASRLAGVRMAFDLQDDPIKKVHKTFKSALNFIHLYDDALSWLAVE